MNPRKFAPGTPFQKWKSLIVALIKTRAWVCILQLKLPCWCTQSLNFSTLEVWAEITLPGPNEEGVFAPPPTLP